MVVMRGAVNSKATRSIIAGALLVAAVGSVTIHFTENESRDSARDAAHDGISLTPQPPRGDSRDVTDRGLGTSVESSRLLVSTGGDAEGGSQVGQDDGESLDVLLGDEDEEIGSGDAPKDEERLRRRLSRTDVLAQLESPRTKSLSEAVDLSRVHMASMDLESVDLSFVDFGGSDLSAANLRHANLQSSNLAYANLEGATLAGADLRTTQMAFVDLSQADLRNINASVLVSTDGIRTAADLFGADLRGADLRGADLSGVSLLGADLREADLRGADLGKAIYNAETRFPAGFDPGSQGMVQWARS